MKITNEMVENACRAAYPGWDEIIKEAERVWKRKQMHSALSAALQSAADTPPSPEPNSVGRIAELEAQNERLREALELIADTDIKPFRSAAIARDTLAAEDRTSQEELDDMVASAIEAAMETSPEFNHNWRSVPEKDVIPEILDEIPAEYTEQQIADAIYRYKMRRLAGSPAPQPREAPLPPSKVREE